MRSLFPLRYPNGAERRMLPIKWNTEIQNFGGAPISLRTEGGAEEERSRIAQLRLILFIDKILPVKSS